MVGTDVPDTLELRERYTQARNILQRLEFVEGINQAWFGGGNGIVAVFCFDFRTAQGSKLGWIVCGDMPWLFAPFADQDSSRAMLERYVKLTRQWNSNGGTEPAGYRFSRHLPDWVSEVEARMRFVEDHVLPAMPVVKTNVAPHAV
jgi:hypothetical protein